MPVQASLAADINVYLEEVRGELNTGVALEHAYRPALKKLLEAIGQQIKAVNDPKHIDAGAPDFVVLRGDVPIGYVECKDVGKDLDDVEESEQIKRYHSLGNLIVTDYVEFRWYVGGEKRLTARLGSVDKRRIRSDREGKAAVADLLMQFAMQEAVTVGTAGELARWMARITREVDRLILRTYEQEGEDGPLHAQKAAFQKALIPDLSDEQFSDMYAQTMAYGLFAAAVRWDEEGRQGDFTRWTVERWLPPTNPFLKKLFHTIAGVDLPEQVSWLVDDGLVGLLKRADLGEIVRDFGKATRQDDPVVHFYEDFLAAYDPALRERRGVYYTPEPVVSYIVRSVDWLLKEKFGRPDGLADERTMVLDPAAGTGTFLYFVIQLIHQRLVEEQGQAGAWDEYVQRHLLPRIFGFELLMAPYSVAHMKLGIQLQETGYQFGSNQRLGIYLTNTLEEAIKTSQGLPFLQYIAEESGEAAKVKRDKPIMVVLGNPPYSGHSANRSEEPTDVAKGMSYVVGWQAGKDGRARPIQRVAKKPLKGVNQPTFIGRLLRDYYFVDGEPLGERNPKWLQDDYVKFIRFGQWRIEQTGEGILAFVTNHGYLDNITFRGMRQQLMETFDELFVLNIHGNSKKRETPPSGGVDENVFDIQQGVAIGIFIKKATCGSKPPRIYYADLWGIREEKYSLLHATDVTNTEWSELRPSKPFYLFVPQDIDLWGEYRQYPRVADAVPHNLLGFQTHRDGVAIAFEEATLQRQVHAYLGKAIDKDTWEYYRREADYRPFDTRVSYLGSEVADRPRLDVIRHLFSSNLALNLVRQTKLEHWNHALVSTNPTPAVYLEIKDGSSIFPLYLYPDPTKLLEDFDWPPGKDGRRPNLNPDFVHEVAAKLGLTFVTEGRGDLAQTFGPEDVFHYIYAVFHSPTYRERYAEFLRIDFPRVPLTGDRALFAQLAGKGAELVSLHLMKHPKLGQLITSFPVKGSNEVASRHPRYVEPDEEHGGRVYINKKQYFEGVEPDVWEFHVGGYQVLDKWLKDRKGRELAWEDVKHYQRIVVALKETMRLMEEIDAAIEAGGGWPLV
ncbi:MAG: type ISP restriction/modification enzyme [Aggregatilineales bacterium]